MSLSIDVSQPFFTLPEPRRGRRAPELTPVNSLKSSWNDYRAGLNEKRIEKLLDVFSDGSHPTLVELMRKSRDLTVRSLGKRFVAWNPDRQFPELYERSRAEAEVWDAPFLLESGSTPSDAPADEVEPDEKSIIAFDLRSLDYHDVPATLKLWFAQSNSK